MPSVSLQSNRAAKIVQIISTRSGRTFALVHENDQNLTDSGQSKVSAYLIPVTPNMRSAHARWLGTGSRLSHLVEDLEDPNIYHLTQENLIETQDGLSSEIYRGKVDLSLEFGQIQANWEETPLTHLWDGAVYDDESRWIHPQNSQEAQALRQKINPLVLEHFLPISQTKPLNAFWNYHKQLNLFISNRIESTLIDLEAETAHQTSPLDTRLDLSPEIQFCRSTNVGAPLLVTISPKQLLGPQKEFLNSTKAENSRFHGAQALVITEFEGLRVFRVRDLEIEGSIQLTDCEVQGATLTATGYVTPQSGQRRGKSLVWVLSYDLSGGNAKEITAIFEFDENAVSTFVRWDPVTQGYLVGGRHGFHQARTGSVSTAQGFLIRTDREFKELERFSFAGPRSTNVTTAQVYVDPRLAKRLIYVGGYTNGPTTHSWDRGSEAFLSTVQINPNQNNNKE